MLVLVLVLISAKLIALLVFRVCPAKTKTVLALSPAGLAIASQAR